MTKKQHRTHGNGSVTLRPNRKKPFLAQLMTQGKRVSRSFASKTEAEIWLRDMSFRTRSVTDVELLNASIKTATSIWLDQKSISWSEQTYLGYKRILIKYIIPAIGNKRILNVAAMDIQRIMTNAKDTGASLREIKYIWQCFSSFYSYLIKLGVVSFNPAIPVSKPTSHQTSKPARYFTQEQSQTLLNYLAQQNDPLENLYSFALSTGAREAEILGLKWQNINWGANSVSIVQQVQWTARKNQGQTRFIFKELKTPKSKRQVVVGPKTMMGLRNQQKKIEMMRQVQGDHWRENDLVFPSDVGTPMEATNLIRRYKKLLQKAGVPDYTFHSLRHTHASLLLLRGVHPKVVSERLGHADVATTLRIYSHVLPSLQGAVATVIEETLYEMPKPASFDL